MGREPVFYKIEGLECTKCGSPIVLKNYFRFGCDNCKSYTFADDFRGAIADWLKK